VSAFPKSRMSELQKTDCTRVFSVLTLDRFDAVATGPAIPAGKRWALALAGATLLQ
jgi:hypothetical protein